MRWRIGICFILSLLVGLTAIAWVQWRAEERDRLILEQVCAQLGQQPDRFVGPGRIETGFFFASSVWTNTDRSSRYRTIRIERRLLTANVVMVEPW